MLLEIAIGSIVGFVASRIVSEHEDVIDKAYDKTKKYMDDVIDLFDSSDDAKKQKGGTK